MRCVAIIPAFGAASTIADALESLRIANAPFVERVLVVTPRDDATAAVVRSWGAHDDGVELVETPSRLGAGAARNLGRERAGGADLLLFVDADCRLERGGAARLAAGLEETGAAAVAARVLGSRGAVARVRHQLEFKEAASSRRPPRGWLPTSTSLLCRASAFDAAGGFPDLWPGEDLVLASRLRRMGLGIERHDSVATHHRHPVGVREMLRHQRRLGRTSAEARRLAPMPGSVFSRRPWLAPLLLPGRLARLLAWQAGEGRRELASTLALLPLVLAGLASWTLGFLEGAVPHARPDAGAAAARARGAA